MKFNISLLTITVCASLCASDGQPQRTGLAATLARLRANRGQTAPEVQREQQSAPSARDLVKAAQSDNPEDFEKTLHSFLNNNPGCKTWDESCESLCPDFDTEFDDDTDLSTLPGFDQPISCKDYLGSCYRNLRGCPPEVLNKKMRKIVGALLWPTNYSAARCKITGLICQGADANADGRIGGASLRYAAYYNDYQFAKFLLEHGASVNASGKNFQATPLHLNMHNAGNTQTARLLIDNGADVEAKSKNGNTPLMELASLCFHYTGVAHIIDKAKLLFSAGAKTHHRGVPFNMGTAWTMANKNSSQYNSEPCKALADYIKAHEEQQSRIQE